MEPNIHLHHPCMPLVTPTSYGCPKFGFSSSYFCLILTTWLLVPLLSQGLWQTQPRVAPRPPGDKKVNPKPSRDVQMSWAVGASHSATLILCAKGFSC